MSTLTRGASCGGGSNGRRAIAAGRQARWPSPPALPALQALLALLAPLGLLAAPPAAAARQEVQESAPPAVAAAPGPASDLKRLSIEELMEIDVTSVSKRPEKLSTAAAAITVITADDIRRSGAATLADALRLAGSLQVAQADGHTWAITARGFNNTLSDKLLVLIDGRSVYTPLFAGVFWDVQQVVLADVDRIEVIRGPGSTLWGANAVNGVINVITRDAAATQGGLAVAGGGAGQGGFGTVRYGGQIGDETAYRAYSKYLYSDALPLAGGGRGHDPLRLGQGGFRIDGKASPADAFTFQGDVYTGRLGQLAEEDGDVNGLDLLGRWSRRFAAGSDLSVQLYFDQTHRKLPEAFEEHRNTFDLDLAHHFRAGTAHDLVWGLGYRVSGDRVVDSPQISWVPDRRTLSLVNAFAQDEIALGERLRLTAGSKFEYNSFTHFEVEPSVRLSWTPSERQTLWGAISRAVRIPAQIDTDSRFTAGQAVLLQGNPAFQAESLLAYELGYRAQPGRRLSVDLATFYNVYDHLRSEELGPGGSLPITLDNKLRGQTFGGELAVKYQMTSWWRWSGTFTNLHEHLRPRSDSTDPTGGAPEGDDPADQWSLRASLDLPRQIELDGWLRHVDRLPSPVVPAYTEADLRLGWRPAAKLELSLIGHNLLHAHHPEFGAASPLRELVQRSVYGKVEWRF